MITMIDYGFGNLRSVQKALEQVGAEVTVTDDPAVVSGATKLVLPGVGAFGAAMDTLKERALAAPLIEAAGQGVPLLGICLGMQLLFEESEERGQHQGLGLLPGRVVRFSNERLKVPHIGWNQIAHNESHPLLHTVPSGAYTYFVHSYFCHPTDPQAQLASTEYGPSFASIAGRKNIVGIQFHPEKSHRTGLRILKNFVEWKGA